MVIKVFLFLFFLSIAHASISCPLASCNEDVPTIRFPFWLQGTPRQEQQRQQLNSSCTLSGFNLSCNSKKYLILHIPGSGDFNLTSVDYYNRRVTLQDVEGCLPTRLLSLNLSSTPLLAIMYRNYTFFSCSKGNYPSYRSYTKCASNETSDVFAMGEDATYGLNFSGCSKIATVPVPVSSFNFSFGNLPVDLKLTWDLSDPPEGNKQLSESSSVALILIIPILMFLLIAIVGFACMKKRGSQHNSTSSIQISEEAGGVTSKGPDQSSIEAYTKIAIVERLVEGPNGVTCTICQTDYATNDTIRFMPNCEHYFHVECINKWLSISRKCPVCRTSLPNANSC